MSSGDKMAPFLASEMAWVCHVIFFNYVYIYTNYDMKTRNGMKYVVNFAKSKKYFNSSIPYFQKLLNKEERDKGKLIKNISI